MKYESKQAWMEKLNFKHGEYSPEGNEVTVTLILQFHNLTQEQMVELRSRFHWSETPLTAGFDP